ncbi:MAG: bifunctional demethylmenaquinone methyltransferase/2-methoxy-6-polyprenyl-1,4-benzoquinol methylase UbiE [Planctomycetota bacterium]|jgi:demethylmenaquinone methyltransferase/2-methoxy-6-polyprenyl-1,4-benzoquinol methylase
MTPSPDTSSASSSAETAWTANELRQDPHQQADKADRVQRMFEAIADSYDLNNRLHSFGRDQAWRRAAVRLCRVGPTDRVLDVACGTGDLAEAFCRARPEAVVGADFTNAMLERARAKANARRRRPGEPAPSYILADAMDLQLQDASFDVVSIAFGIRNVSNPNAAAREFRRILRPGGRVVILEFSEPRNPVLRALSRLYTCRIMPRTASLIARDRSGAYRYLPASISTFLDREAMRRLLEEAGFENVTTHPMTFGVCVAYLGHVPGGPAAPA